MARKQYEYTFGGQGIEASVQASTEGEAPRKLQKHLDKITFESAPSEVKGVMDLSITVKASEMDLLGEEEA